MKLIKFISTLILISISCVIGYFTSYDGVIIGLLCLVYINQIESR